MYSAPRDQPSGPPTAPAGRLLSPGLDEPRTVRAVEPADLISYIDHTLGYRPAHSCVALTLDGTTIGASLRLDRPQAGAGGRSGGGPDLELAMGYARRVARLLSADTRATASVVFLFAGPEQQAGLARFDETATPMDLLLTAELRRALDAAGCPAQEIWLVGAGRIWHLDCEDLTRCPYHGTPVQRSETSAVNATFIVEGSVVRPGPEAQWLPAPAEEPSAELSRALDRLRTLDSPAEVAAEACRWLTHWESILTGECENLDGLSGTAAAELMAGLADPRLRDTLIASASFTLRRAVSGAVWLGQLPAQLDDLAGARASEANALLYVSVLLADTRRGPDWDRVDRLLGACAALLPGAHGTAASALQCLAAWAEWARGRGSLAGRVVHECRRRDPEYSLGELLAEVVDSGMVAGWASRRETAWTPRRGRTQRPATRPGVA